MLTVWKYPVTLDDWFSLALPQGARVLTVHTQMGVPFLWAMVDSGAPTVIRRFRFAGTGHDLDVRAESLSYVGTFQINDGALVFHLFEVKEADDGQ